MKGNTIQDRELYEDLVRSHARDVYRFAFRLSGSADIAEELTQETMYHAWRSISSLRDQDRARAWLLQILHNRHKHWLRTRSRRVVTINDSDQLNQTADQANNDLLKTLSNQELLQRSLDALENRYKEPFLLVFMEGMTCNEAAEFLDLPLGTVLSRIYRARRQLRGIVAELDPSPDHSRNSDSK